MKTHIVVGGLRDGEVLEKLLSDLPSTAERRIVALDDKDGARPVARQIVLRVREPTAFVFDTDTTDRVRVRNEIQGLTDYFNFVPPRARFEMFPMVPAFEILFFERPATLERRMGGPLDAITRRAGKHAPKEVLEEILPSLGAASLDELFRSLTE